MSESTRDEEQIVEEDEVASQGQRMRGLPPLELDVIYIGGFPPVWQIWRRKGGMVTIQVEPQESRLSR